MRKKNYKGRCEKHVLGKCQDVCRTYDSIQYAYADVLQESEEVKEIRCNVLLDGLEIGDYTSDFVCVKTDGILMVRECVFRKFLLKPLTVKLLDASRDYWLRHGVTDWGLDNPLEIAYIEYLSDILDVPIDFENDTPISAVLYHFMSRTKYLKSSGKTRYTKQLTDDLSVYYKNIGLKRVASIYQIQRTLLGKGFNFSVVCQIAFFLGMGVEELVEAVLTDEQIEQERNSHFMKDIIPIDWKTYDEETAPILEQVASDIYYGKASETGRPERVSERIIYRELGLPEHRLENLPKCKVIMEKYQESYEENWSRRLIWAYKKLKAERKGEEFYWSDIRLISGVKKENIDKVIPYLEKYTDADTLERIKGLL